MPHLKIHRQRIVLVAGTILMVVTLLVGVTVFIVMERHAQELLSKSLQLSLQNLVQLTEADIRTGFGRTTVAATRPQLIDQVQRVNTGADDGTARVILNKGAASFLSTGLTAIAVFDKDGRELARGGTFAQKSALTVPLNLPGRVQLMWDGQLLLHAAVEMNQAGQVVGKVVTEASLPVTTGAFKDASRLGETGELALCAPFGLKLQCFPTTLSPRIFTAPQRSPDGVPLPMTHALEGETGFVTTRDYRDQEVVAAYAPVGDSGLGMVLKMDSAELYAPVWMQLRYLIPLLLGVLVIALLLLRWLLTPLVLRLVRSEAQARELSASLRDSERHERAVLDNVDEGIVTISHTGNIELFNPAAERLFGYRSEEVVGKNVSMLMPEPYHSEHDGYLARYLHTGQAKIIGTGREVTGRRSDGSVFPMELRVSEFSLEGRRQFIGCIRDITERKLAQARIAGLNTELEQRVQRRTAQLEASNRNLQEFAYSVAHDLRQPFIAIGGFSGLLERTVKDERARHYIARIKEGVRQAGELTDALLALANLSRVQLRVQSVDLSVIAHRVMDSLQQKDPTRVASISIQSGLVVQADPMLLRLVMEELMGNAWKFTSRRSHTEISFGMLSAEAGTVGAETVYVVRDNGEGFDMAHADKLFRSFQRLHAPQDFPGAGVGLANIQRIIARHGGQIWAESALGEGASFFFSLGNARP
jgi:PAS domain S-box-containing protein